MFGMMGVARMSGQQRAFSPLSLFAASEQGAWYDPSDFSSMFQDSAGTGPVTAVEQPVGRINDKSGNGNHASQPTTAARPVVSARVNLLERAEEFDNVYWTKLGVSAPTANSVIAPDGTLTAETVASSDSVSGNTGIYRTLSFAAGHSLSVYAKANTSSIAWISSNSGESYGVFNLAAGTVIDSGNAAASIVSVGNGWYRLIVANTTVSSAYVIIGGKDSYTSGHPWGNGTWTSGNSIYLWGAQLETGSTATRYQRVTTASDYDAVGFPHYLAIDGVDDRLDISSLSLIDGMDCFIAVNTNSGVTNQSLFTLDVGYSAYFGIWSSGSYAVTYGGAVGTPEVAVDGTVLPSALRNDLYGALTVGDWHILEYRGLDLSTWTTMLLFGGGHIPFSGDVGGIVLCPSQDEATRAKVRQYLGNKVGLSL